MRVPSFTPAIPALILALSGAPALADAGAGFAAGIAIIETALGR